MSGSLDNIITALQQEKSICENVMSSAWQIRMFVNAPKAYAKRKDQNRVGNSKRPNTKNSEGAGYEPRALKRPRTTASIRGKQVQDGSMTPEPRLLGGTTPQQKHKRQLQPTVHNSPDTNVASSMLPMCSPPDACGARFGQQANAVLLSTTLSQPVHHVPQQIDFLHDMSMPSIGQPLLSSPPPPTARPLGHVAGSATRNMTGSGANVENVISWEEGNHLRFLPSASEQGGIMNNSVSGERQQTIQPFSPCDAPDYSNIFARHTDRGVCLSDVEAVPSYQDNEHLQDDFFYRYWEQQQPDAQHSSDTSK